MSFPVYMTANTAAPLNILGTCQACAHTLKGDLTSVLRAALATVGRWVIGGFISAHYICLYTSLIWGVLVLLQQPIHCQQSAVSLTKFSKCSRFQEIKVFFVFFLFLVQLLLYVSPTAEYFRSFGEYRAECRCRHRLFSSTGRGWYQLRQPQRQESPGSGGRRCHAAAYQELLWETQVCL